MAARKFLIVNADDFGQSLGVNRGIVQAHEEGIVTSASLMVRWPAAADAAEYSRADPRLSLGLHLDLGEWICRDETWVPVYEVAPTDNLPAVADEMFRQLEAFRRLVGRNPTHLDSHQHVHLREPARSLAINMARELRIPLRHCHPGIRYCGDFYGQTETGQPLEHAIGVDHLLAILAAVQPGSTELACHPGMGEDLETMYRRERALEVRTLCDRRIRAAIMALGIELCSFEQFAVIENTACS